MPFSKQMHLLFCIITALKICGKPFLKFLSAFKTSWRLLNCCCQLGIILEFSLFQTPFKDQTAFTLYTLHLRGLTYFPHYSRFPADEKSQAYRYFNGKCPDELNRLTPPVQSFTSMTRFAKMTKLNRPHPFRITLLRRTFQSEGFYPRTTSSWNRLPRECFPEHNNLNFF